MKSKIEYSINELIATLKRTSLPTIIVEGSDDIIIYRKLEEILSGKNISTLPVGGREKVLALFLRRNEFSNTKCAFIADKDVWVTTGVPHDYISDCLFFTEGYSIENEVYVDARLRNMIPEADLHHYEKDLDSFIEWYALALSRHLQDPSEKISLHSNQVLNQTDRKILIELKQSETYPNELKEHIRKNYMNQLRGKSLLDIFNRRIKICKGINHNNRTLFDTVAARPGDRINSIFSKVCNYI